MAAPWSSNSFLQLAAGNARIGRVYDSLKKDQSSERHCVNREVSLSMWTMMSLWIVRCRSGKWERMMRLSTSSSMLLSTLNTP